MKKIPTLFTRIFDGRKIVGITSEITPGCEEAFLRGAATVKYDGSCCAVIKGELYKRYDAKKGRKPPVGAIPCCAPDPVTGHWPHWVKVDPDNPSDKWYLKAYKSYQESICGRPVVYFTYEAIGKHFNGNPYGMDTDTLLPHGDNIVTVGRTFEDVKNWLQNNDEEGLVFWFAGEPVCKIKRTDFGLEWPSK